MAGPPAGALPPGYSTTQERERRSQRCGVCPRSGLSASSDTVHRDAAELGYHPVPQLNAPDRRVVTQNSPVRASLFIVALLLGCGCGAVLGAGSRHALDASTRLVRRSLPGHAGFVTNDDVVYLRHGAGVEAIELQTGRSLAVYESVGTPLVTTRGGAALLSHSADTVHWVDLRNGTTSAVTLGVDSDRVWRVTEAWQSERRPSVVYFAMDATAIVAPNDSACCGGGSEPSTLSPGLAEAFEVDFRSGECTAVPPEALRPLHVRQQVLGPRPFRADDIRSLDLVYTRSSYNSNLDWLEENPPARLLGLSPGDSPDERQLVWYERGPSGIPLPHPTSPPVTGEWLRRLAVQGAQQDWSRRNFFLGRCTQQHTAVPVVCEGWVISDNGRVTSISAPLLDDIVFGSPSFVQSGMLLGLSYQTTRSAGGEDTGRAAEFTETQTGSLHAYALATGEEVWTRIFSRVDRIVDNGPDPM